MVKLKLFNTLTRKKEIFKPLEDKIVKLYTCGPTVYDYAHIGNFRAFVCEDILRRVLEYNGYKVIHVMNITDVGHLVSDADTGEDKIQLSARKRRKTAWEIAEFFTKAFFEDAEQLNLLKAHFYPRATQHIKEMIEWIKKLEEKSFTYIISDGVYFDTSKFKEYGKLTGMNFEELNKKLKAGARVEFNPEKRNITDFALWKFSPKDKKRDMEWDSPWGKGFPGWHIECSVMAVKYLGETIDIHAGGVDHIPIHHTNEIAQTEAITGKLFVRYWFHCEHLIVEGRKMSKSLGNFYTLRDLLSMGWDWRSIRFLLFSAHYRQQLNFTFKSLESAKHSVETLKNFLINLKNVKKGMHSKKVSKLVRKVKKEFLEAINDDLNMPKALATIFNFIREVNKLIKNKKMSKKDAERIIKIMLDFDRVLGLKLEEFLKPEEIPEEIKKLVEEREEARKKKDFEKADKIREEIRKMGYIIEDTKEGPIVKRVEK